MFLLPIPKKMLEEHYFKKYVIMAFFKFCS